MTSTIPARPSSHATGRRVVAASTIGTALEWYDFMLFGTASALVLNKVIFDPADPAAGTLASFATFAVGFFARPIGGIVFGHLGDRLGRQLVLVITLTGMAVSSTLIGLIPSYDSIGLWAAVILVILRILQGLGAGAEYAGGSLMAAEHAPTNRRGLYAAIPPTGNALGVILATIVFTPFTWLPEADFHAWGWRIPFILSIVLLPIGIWIRRRVDETPSFKNVEAEGIKEKVPFLTVLRTHPKQLILGILASVGPNVATYVPSVYALTYITDNVGQAAWIGTVGVLVANVVKLVTLPFSGHLSDRLGRKPIFISGAILCALMSFPFFWMLDTGVTIVIWLALVILLTFSNDLMLGSQATLLTEQFTNNVRFSGVAASREISAALAGGTLPFIAAALTTSTHGTLAISLVMRGMSAISIIGAALLREGSGKKIS
jgi:MFS family permease